MIVDCISSQKVTCKGPSTVSESRFYAGLDNGGDLADNVTCLGRCGVYKTLDGLTIGYLSGHSNSKDDQNYAVQDNAHIKLKGQFLTPKLY